MLVVPFTSDPAQSFTVQLGDGKYIIDARYNDRSKSWTFDLTRDADQVMLVAGVPLLLGGDLLAPYPFNIGALTAVDSSQADVEAGPDDLGERALVVWASPLELAIMNGDLSPTAVPATIPILGSTGTLTIVVQNIINQYSTSNVTSTTVVGLQVPLVDNQQHADSTGTEVLVSQFAVDLTPNPAGSVTLDVSFFASAATGTATFRAYVGGTVGAIDGTLVGAVTRNAAPFAALRIAGAVANTHTVVPVKITIQSNSVGISAAIDDLTGTIG